MKTNGTLINGKLWLTAFVLLLMVTSSKAQTSGADFSFTTHSLISGTDRQVGAIYLFPDVRTGIDCRVTIMAITPGTSVQTFDDNAAGAGYFEAFQPRIQANARTRGYGEFHFRMVKHNTNIDTVVGEIPASSVDVDGMRSGTDSLLEFDEYFLPTAYIIDYDMLAGQLSFNWLLGSILGRHKASIEYTGIDTTGRSVMFTVVYPHTSNFTVRIGVDNNTGGSVTRQRSVYFKRFLYPNSFLPARPLKSFAGVSQDNGVKLNWTMNKGHNIITADVEKSVNGVHFMRVSAVSMASENNKSYSEENTTASTWYRLRLTDATGKVSYSEVLMMKRAAGNQSAFKVFPSVVKDYTTINFSAANAGAASLALTDNNGRIVKRQNISVQQGFNSAVVNGLDQVPAGQYVAVLNGAGYTYSQKILITK